MHRRTILTVFAGIFCLSFIGSTARAADGDPEDFRLAAFRRALEIVADGRPERARRVLELLSDHTAEPIESAAGLKGAHGAPPE